MKKLYLLFVLVTVFVACKEDRDVEFSTFVVENEKIVVSYTSVNLSCKVRCAATINEFYLQYDTVADFSTYQEIELVENEKTEVYSVKIGDLLDNTTYYVRYVAVNSYSQVTSEEVSEFKTLQATTPTIEVREITDVLDTIATVSFVLKFNGGADIMKIGVCWSVDSVPTIDSTHVVYSIDTEKGVADGDSLVLNISGLEENTIYYVRAYAENKMGFVYSDSKSFITLTLPEVKTGDVSEIQYTSAVLHGEAIFDGNEPATIYGFCWSEEENPTLDDANIQVSKTIFSYRLSNLLDETKYYVRAYAKNKIGVVYGEEKEFVTKIVELPVVETSEVTDITYTSAKVGGSVISDGGAEITELGICYSMTENPTIANSKIIVNDSLDSFIATLSRLQDGIKYYVRAYAKNKKGVSYGKNIVFETKAYSLPEVVTCNPKIITYMSAIVGGIVVSDGGLDIIERGVCYSTMENPTIENSKVIANKGLGSFSKVILDLKDDEIYYVRAYAINSKGVVYGEEFSFRTLDFIDQKVSINTVVICEGDWYDGFGFSIHNQIKSDTVLSREIKTFDGYDSVVILNLEVEPIRYGMVFDTICFGGTYSWNGHSYVQSGIYREVLVSSTGCDSIVTLHLKVNEEYRKTINAVINDGEEYNENGFNGLSREGTYTLTLKTILGCDSTIILNLVVLK